jgi:hypothetical protein
MATKGIPGWVIFSLIGLAVLILAIAGLAVGGFFHLKGAIQEFEAADAALEEVEDLFGPIADYRPDPTGAIPAARIEAFLAVRDGTAIVRETTEHSLKTLSNGEGEQRAGTFRKVGAGVWLLHRSADYLAERSALLKEAGMGLGEYYYLYTVAYFSWLDKSPADGPSFKLVGDRGYVLESVPEALDNAEVREHRSDLTRASLNRLLLPVLRNQLSDLPVDSDDPELRRWRETLSAEIAALEADDRRLPWEDGVPEAIASSLLPYRERLGSTYSAMCNELEVGVARR